MAYFVRNFTLKKNPEVVSRFWPSNGNNENHGPYKPLYNFVLWCLCGNLIDYGSTFQGFF
jgi:hypothetical protein